MILFMYIGMAFLFALLIVTVFNACTAPMLKKTMPLRRSPRVSVLIPARNEERNLRDCLEGLLRQHYEDLEILVLNDDSQDRTGEIIKQFCKRDLRVRCLEGRRLPEGWTGKNWACHQLSQEARGEVFIFTDADNRHAPAAIANTVGWMDRLELGLFSAFPQQITVGPVEKLVIPIVEMFVYSGLPLWLTYYTRPPSVSAANGQWIAFARPAYQLVGGHEAVRNRLVEDVELSRLAKRKGVRILMAAGTGVISGRMYRSPKEVWEGFSKNLFGLMGYKTVPFFIILSALFFACILPYFAVWISSVSTLAASAIAANVLLRSILALKYKHPLFASVVLHPIGMMFILVIGINSFLQVKRGRVQWKGRQIDIRTLSPEKR